MIDDSAIILFISENQAIQVQKEIRSMHAFRPEKIRPRATGSVTLSDVAKLAGVSPITVSRVLNQPEKVAPKTLAKVQKAIARTGYVPNLLAGGLASRRSRLIAAIVPSIANSVYAETIKFFSEKMREAGYQVLLGESGYSEEQEESLIATILQSRPDGVFLTGINHSSQAKRLLLAADIPVVETWDITPTPLDVVVGFSHQRVGQAVATYLLCRNTQGESAFFRLLIIAPNCVSRRS
jgi:LacI family gluconate utilization system Gnt-I transcriptional repressor